MFGSNRPPLLSVTSLKSSGTFYKSAVPLQQRADQQEDVVRREADEEDEDGAADQLSDPHLLIRLSSRAATHRSKDAQVADLRRRETQSST